MRISRLLVLAGAVLAVARSAQGQPVTVALDNADNSQYTPQPDNSWGSANGGFGYNLWTPLGGVSGGGTYMESSRQVEGTYSFGVFSANGSYAISRPLTNSILGLGEFDILTRFDLTANTGGGLVNLRSGNNTSGFGAGELLSFGIVNGNQLDYTDSSGFHTLSSGEARGAIWSWTIDFNAAAGTYSASVAQVGGGFSTTFGGNFEANGNSVGSFGILNNSDNGSGNQNLIFDVPQFEVIPEPSSMALLGMGIAVVLGLRRRKL